MSSMSSTKIFEVDFPPSDSPSSISFSKHDLFSVSAWDGSLSFFNYINHPFILKSTFTHSEPLLCSSFVNNICVSGSSAGSVFSVDINTGLASNAKIHEGGIRHIKTMNEFVYITGSWDKTVKFVDIRTQQVVHQLQMPERVYGMDFKSGTLALLLAGNKLITYDTSNMQEKQHTTKLSWSLKCLSQVDDGIVVGGIEGRGEYLSTSVSTKRYSFRCHRTTNEMFSINHIATYPKNDSCFMTCGSDGSIIMYDKSVRQKLFSESFKTPVCCGEFSPDGSVFVLGVGYDWSRGYENSGDKPGVKIIQMNSTNIKV
ncbi:hypothetical protein GVAV_003379 [Gurleya vavrai]